MHRDIGTRHSDAQVRKYRFTQCFDKQVYRYTATQVHNYTGTHVHRYIAQLRRLRRQCRFEYNFKKFHLKLCYFICVVSCRAHLSLTPTIVQRLDGCGRSGRLVCIEAPLMHVVRRSAKYEEIVLNTALFVRLQRRHRDSFTIALLVHLPYATVFDAALCLVHLSAFCSWAYIS